MTSRRIILTVALSFVIAKPALAIAPIGCTFPTSPDSFGAVAPGQRLTSDLWNQLMCAMNALEARLLGEPTILKACAAATVAAGTRQAVSVGMSAPLAGTETPLASVVDGTAPSRVFVDGIQSITGNTVNVWIFNRDPTSSRSVQVCAAVLK